MVTQCGPRLPTTHSVLPYTYNFFQKKKVKRVFDFLLFKSSPGLDCFQFASG